MVELSIIKEVVFPTLLTSIDATEEVVQTPGVKVLSTLGSVSSKGGKPG